MNTNRHAVKQPLLNLMKNDNPQRAIEAVLNSGLLPEPQLRQWLDNLTERAIRRMLGRSGCPEWEEWAARWLSGEDRSAAAARAASCATAWAASCATAWAAARAARAAAWAATDAAWAATDAAWAATNAAAWAARAARAAAWAATEERKAQYDDLLSVINSLPGEA